MPLEQKASLAEVNEALKLPVEKSLIEPYRRGDKFQTALTALRKHAKSKSKKLPIFVDHESFRQKNPESANFLDQMARIPEKTANGTVGQFLRLALDGCPDAQAVYVVSSGAVVITHKSVAKQYPPSKTP